MFEWVKGNAQLEVVTLNDNNITLNQNAASHFSESKYVMVGFSKDNRVAIRPVTKRDMELNVFPKENLHKISIGKGYAKISNKALCDLIASKVQTTLSGQKIVANFDAKENVLVFDLATFSEKGVIL